MYQFYVYIFFYLTGIPCYVGKGKGRRWLDHERKKNPTSIHLKRLILEAKRQSLELPKIKIRENLSEEEAFVLERELIKAIGRRDLGTGPLVNLTDGGDGEAGRVVSQKTRELLRNLNLGKTLTEEHKNNIGSGVKASGFKFNEEQLKSISEKQIGKSKVWTPEGRERFVAFHTGKQWHLGHKHSEETKEVIREKARASWVIRKEKAMRNVTNEVL